MHNIIIEKTVLDVKAFFQLKAYNYFFRNAKLQNFYVKYERPYKFASFMFKTPYIYIYFQNMKYAILHNIILNIFST